MINVIPAAALTQHIAVLGKTGSGKSYAIRGAAVEPLLERGERVCVIDPTGAWHGLRSSATGKSAGLPVVIFGGSHADLPLTVSHGETIAEAIGTTTTPSIIDTSLMKVGERTKFFADFADAIVRKNRGPLHLVIDEAHLFMPQGKVNDPQSGAMLHAANNMVSLGRSRGLRIILITQRPAKLHKDALTQAETLIAMRLIAPQDRAAVEAWIEDNADDSKAREIISSLATLKTGQGWIWAPELGVLERVTFPRIRTYDSGRAPDGTEGEAAKVLAPIDLDAIGEKLKTVANEAKANDPKELRRRIAELERQVAAKPAAAQAEPKIEVVEIPALTADEHAQLNTLIREAQDLKNKAIHLATAAESIDAAAHGLVATIDARLKARPAPAAQLQRQHAKEFRPESAPHSNRKAISNSAPAMTSDGFKLNSAQQRILDALAWYASLGDHAPTLTKIGAVALIDPTGGHFSNTVGPLSTHGFVDRGDGCLRLTDAGRALARAPERATSLSEYHDVLRQRVRKMKSASGKTIEILDAIVAARGAQITTEQIGADVGIDHTGGHFSNSIGPLGTAGLITRKGGIVTPTDVLFPEGLV